MNQIQQQGKDMLEIIEKYEVPQEYHNALWTAYEAGAEMGFWKAAAVTFKGSDLAAPRPLANTDVANPPSNPTNTTNRGGR